MLAAKGMRRRPAEARHLRPAPRRLEPARQRRAALAVRRQRADRAACCDDLARGPRASSSPPRARLAAVRRTRRRPGRAATRHWRRWRRPGRRRPRCRRGRPGLPPGPARRRPTTNCSAAWRWSSRPAWPTRPARARRPARRRPGPQPPRPCSTRSRRGDPDAAEAAMRALLAQAVRRPGGRAGRPTPPKEDAL